MDAKTRMLEKLIYLQSHSKDNQTLSNYYIEILNRIKRNELLEAGVLLKQAENIFFRERYKQLRKEMKKYEAILEQAKKKGGK